MSKTILTCLSLIAVDGDTAHCDGKGIRPLGPGQPNVEGFDTPEIYGRADCAQEALMGARAMVRFAELLMTPGLTVEDSGVLDAFDRPLVWLRLPTRADSGGGNDCRRSCAYLATGQEKRLV